MPDSIAIFFAQVTNAVSATPPDASAGTAQPPVWINFAIYGLMAVMVYFLFFRPQMQTKKKQEETIKGAKTGDKVVTTSGIHGVITNVKDSTVIVRVADNVKLEIEKTHLDKITRASASADSEKDVVVKA